MSIFLKLFRLCLVARELKEIKRGWEGLNPKRIEISPSISLWRGLTEQVRSGLHLTATEKCDGNQISREGGRAKSLT
jgi:hypothetical protein